jgi:hypothetical protein
LFLLLLKLHLGLQAAASVAGVLEELLLDGVGAEHVPLHLQAKTSWNWLTSS